MLGRKVPRFLLPKKADTARVQPTDTIMQSLPAVTFSMHDGVHDAFHQRVIKRIMAMPSSAQTSMSRDIEYSD